MTPAQQYVMDVALEVEEGRFCYRQVMDFEPRRAGKSHKMKSLVAWRGGLQRRASIWLTAQNQDAAVAFWGQVADLVVESYQRVGAARGVVKHRANTKELLTWQDTGSRFRPFTPTSLRMHGESPDLMLLDEWFSMESLTEQQQLENSFMPPLRVRPMGQVWKLSSAGGPRSVALREDRLRGRAAVESGGRRGIAYFEWCVPDSVQGTPVGDLDDERLVDVVWANHPLARQSLVDESGAVTELRRSELEEALEQDGRARFLREWGNVDQSDDAGELAIGPTVWARQRGAEIPVGSRVGVGVNVDDSGRQGSVFAAWRDPEGQMQVQLIASAGGVQWTVAEVLAMADVGAVAVYNVGRSRDVADQLSVPVGEGLLRLYAPEMAAASARFHDGLVESGQVWHDGHPLLEASLRAAELPPRKAWTSRSGEPVTAVIAASLAVWAADHLPEPDALANIEPRIY